MRRHVMLVTCAVLCAASSQGIAQLEARNDIPWLPWNTAAPFFGTLTANEFELLWAQRNNVDYATNNFMMGWNWLASDREVSEVLEMPIHHIGETWIDTEQNNLPLRERYERVHRPGRILIPSIDEISAVPSLTEANDRYESPSESIAMEFMPWLAWNATTERMDLLADDETGSVFGFRTRQLGAVVSEVVGNTGLRHYRYRLHAADAPIPTVILSNVWPDDQLRVFGDALGGGPARRRFSTERMYVSVTLRRMTADMGDAYEAAHADDEVLRIRLPFRMGQDQTNPATTQITGAIRFSELPNRAAPIVDVTVGGAIVGRRRDAMLPPIDDAVAVEEFIITRGMLPRNGMNDITIEARFNMDLQDNESVTFANDEIVRPATSQNNNPRFYPNDVDVSTSVQLVSPIPNQPPTVANQPHAGRISHLDVEVRYTGGADGIDVDITNIRLETDGARDLFWGEHDNAIVGNHRANEPAVDGAIVTYLQHLHARNQWLTTPPRVGNAAPDGRVASVWKFYGRDEAQPMHWKSFRYINRLLQGRLTTEVGIWWAEGMRHCMGLDELWQGATFCPTSNVATYAIEHGFIRDLVGTAQVRERQYMGMHFGREDNGDPDLRLTTGNYTLPLTQQQQDDDLQAWPRGIQAKLEHTLQRNMRSERHMLFSTDPSHHWYANVWPFASWACSGTMDPADPHWLVAASNARPKSCGELRAQIWSNLILGAHGLLFYGGRDVVPIDNAVAMPDPLPTTPPPAGDAHRRSVLQPRSSQPRTATAGAVGSAEC